jgi:hypothetical protein
MDSDKDIDRDTNTNRNRVRDKDIGNNRDRDKALTLTRSRAPQKHIQMGLIPHRNLFRGVRYCKKNCSEGCDTQRNLVSVFIYHKNLFRRV